jgi:hypothetical protein
MSPKGRPGRPAARRPALDPDWARSEAARAVQAAEALRAYRGFLDGAREHKAGRGTLPALEREVLAQARHAQAELRALSAASLRIARHLRGTGLLGDVLAATRAALKQAGRVSLADLLADVLDDPETAKAVSDLGMSHATLEAITAVVAGTDVTLEADDAGLRARSARAGRDVRLVGRAPAARPESPGGLIFGRLFDAALDRWETPGAFPFDVAEVRPARRGQPIVSDPLDAMLAAAVATRQEMARHVRKLEDTGLATYAGREPASLLTAAGIIGTVASVLLAVGGVLSLVCAAEGRPGSSACIAGSFLLAIAFALLAAAAILAVLGFILQTAASASA